MFGEPRLVGAVRWPGPAMQEQETLRGRLEQVDRFGGGGPPHGDITLVVGRVT